GQSKEQSDDRCKSQPKMHDSRGEGSAPPRRITDHVVYQNKNRDSYNQGHDGEIPSGSHRRACPPVCQRWVACKITESDTGKQQDAPLRQQSPSSRLRERRTTPSFAMTSHTQLA